MGVFSRKNAGFSLLETIIVLGIGSLLAITLLNNFSSSQRQTRFTGAIESVISTLEKTRQEANSAYTTGRGTDPDHIFFAKVMEFSDGDSTYDIHTLTIPRSEAITPPINPVATQSQSIPWGVICACNESPNDNRYIHFVRKPDSTQLRVYLKDHLSRQPSDYNSTDIQSNLCFESPEGLRAVVSINSSSGEITRRYVDSC